MNTPNKVIKIAQPGYYVLELCNDENGLPDLLISHPVIAWAFDTETYPDFLFPEAITLGGNVESGSSLLRDAVMLCPDGRVRSGTDGFWKNESEYLQECIERARRIHATKAEKQAQGAA